MNATSKRRYSKNNITQKNKKYKSNVNKNDCKYKSCKSKIYKSFYGGRWNSPSFF